MEVKSPNPPLASESLTKEFEKMEQHSTDDVHFLDGIDPDVLGYVNELIKNFSALYSPVTSRIESRDVALQVLTKLLALEKSRGNPIAKALKSLIESTPPLQTEPQ